MLAGQKMVDADGYEVALFPMENLHVSQGEHQLYALDFLGWGANGRINNYPVYAPFTGRVVYTGNDHNIIFQSDDKVHFVDGTVDYATVLMAHSETDVPLMGAFFKQGTLLYHTGNYGNSHGDHLHMEVAKGHVRWDSGGLHLKDPYHMWNMYAVNDTIISASGGFDWQDYEAGVTPSTFKHHKFNWRVFERKLRINRLKR